MALWKASFRLLTRWRSMSWKRTTQGKPIFRSRMSSTTSMMSMTGPGWPCGWTTTCPFSLMEKKPAPQPLML